MRLGRYVLESLIGRGGMGEVWKATDTVPGTTVAIKLLPKEIAGSEAEVRRLMESFLRVRELPHPNICPVYQFEIGSPLGPFLVMKYLSGISLAAYRLRYLAQPRPSTVGQVLSLLKPIAEALHFAHSRSVIHRDIKPENILLQPDGGNPQLVDFGLSAQVRRSMTNISQVQFDSSGTPLYMAPEQFRGRPQDGKADQYALAAVVYEMLTGNPPFHTCHPGSLRQCVLEEPPPELPAQLQSRNLSGVLIRALSKDPAKRFDDCESFWRALEYPPRSGGNSMASRRQLARVGVLAGILVGGGYLYRNAPPPAPDVANHANLGPQANIAPPGTVVPAVAASPGPANLDPKPQPPVVPPAPVTIDPKPQPPIQIPPIVTASPAVPIAPPPAAQDQNTRPTPPSLLPTPLPEIPKPEPMEPKPVPAPSVDVIRGNVYPVVRTIGPGIPFQSFKGDETTERHVIFNVGDQVTVTDIQNDRAELTIRNRIGWIPLNELRNHLGTITPGVPK